MANLRGIVMPEVGPHNENLGAPGTPWTPESQWPKPAQVPGVWVACPLSFPTPTEEEERETTGKA